MATRTYEIVTDAGTFRMEIPEEWKVTYGPVFQGGKYGGGENALRVYEAESKQRAIFTGVRSFRDLSIPVKRLLVSEKGSNKWEADRNGRRSKSNVEYERKWVDASDDIPGTDAESESF